MLFNYREFHSNYHLDIRKNDWLIFKNINQVSNNIDLETYYRDPINQNEGIPHNLTLETTLYPKDYLLIVDKNPSNITEYKIKVNEKSPYKKNLNIVIKKYQPS